METNSLIAALAITQFQVVFQKGSEVLRPRVTVLYAVISSHESRLIISLPSKLLPFLSRFTSDIFIVVAQNFC